MKILNDPNVLLLCQQFDLERPEIVTLHVSKYTYDETGIKINEVKVLDSNGNFIKFADIKSLGPHIHKYYITFGRRTESPDKTNTTA
jgi:hypothetical protein